MVDLEHKILVFLHQPHWMLMEKLRPLLSHDRRSLRYSITDKMEKAGLGRDPDHKPHPSLLSFPLMHLPPSFSLASEISGSLQEDYRRRILT
ncbi:MAG: hypothetical protein QXJ15_01875 [Candidatus Bathyarchaeia archaeon]